MVNNILLTTINVFPFGGVKGICYLFYHFGRVSSCHTIGWNIMGDHGAGTYNAVIADGHTWHNTTALADMHVCTYFDKSLGV